MSEFRQSVIFRAILRCCGLLSEWILRENRGDVLGWIEWELRTGIRTEFLCIDTWPFVVTMHSKLLCPVQKHKSELCGQKYLKVKIILLHWRTFVGSKCGIFLRVEAGKERFRLDKREKMLFCRNSFDDDNKKIFYDASYKTPKNIARCDFDADDILAT